MVTSWCPRLLSKNFFIIGFLSGWHLSFRSFFSCFRFYGFIPSYLFPRSGFSGVNFDTVFYYFFWLLPLLESGQFLVVLSSYLPRVECTLDNISVPYKFDKVVYTMFVCISMVQVFCFARIINRSFIIIPCCTGYFLVFFPGWYL